MNNLLSFNLIKWLIKHKARKNLIVCSLLLIFFSTAWTFSQVQVTGIVQSADEENIPGVNIIEKGTTNGTVTDVEGQYRISVAGKDATLVISSIGYKSQEILVGDQTIINVSLVEDVTALDEVIVIGYGKQRKIDLTGSSVSLKSEEINKRPVLSAAQALQGKAAGVQIINSGAPGSAPNVRIRGVGSILGGVDPLYVVDGIITTDIRNINTADIVSMDILKDASSTAIYGARAANGVVLITTKSGEKGFNVSLNSYVGAKVLHNPVEMAGPNLFAIYSNEAAGSPTITAADITGSADWYDELTRPGFFHNHALSVNGSKKGYTYYLSLGYSDENGVLLDNNYKRYTARYNHSYTLFDKLTIGNTLAYSFYNSENKPYSLFTTAYIAAPIYNAKEADGTYGYTTKSDVGNPLASLDYTNDRSYGFRPQGTIWGEYEILEGLRIKTSFGIDREVNTGVIYTPEFYVGTSIQKNEVSKLVYKADSSYHWVWDNFITYEKQWAVHRLKVTAGHTAERKDGWKRESERLNVVDDEDDWVLDFDEEHPDQVNKLRVPIDRYFRKESYFTRINYSFNDRYLLNSTLRRDGSSNFSDAHNWGYFPSVGVGWVISNEGFLSQVQRINKLKLRASFGLVGNDVINAGQFELVPTEGLYAYFGDSLVNGATVTKIVDPNLQWEVVKEFDVGLEFAIFDDEISGEIDFYHKKAEGALYTVPMPTLGFGSELLTNAADIINEGLEISLRWNKTISPETFYILRVNTSFNKNKVVNIGAGRALNYGSLNNGWTSTQTLVGEPIGSFWVFKTNGIFQTQEEINAYPHLEYAERGDFKIVDVVPDGVIDNKDRVHVGSYQPTMTLGVNQSFTWKKIDFTCDLYGVFGNKVYNGKKGVRYGGNYNVEYDVAINRWMTGSNINDYPRAYNGVPHPSDYFIESGSYLKINDVSIGYNLAKLFTSEMIDQFRIYISSQNPYVFTKYTGFTPELPGNQNEAGIELNIYPVPASYIIGLNLQFK